MNMRSVGILVVEDQQPKVAKIIDLLTGIPGIARKDIDVAQSGIEARRLLRNCEYDLMILDVVLPNRPEDPPRRDGGVELLREVMERDGFFHPRYIIGLTAFPEAFQEAVGEFADYTWAIVQYREDEQGWHDPIEQIIRHIRRTGASGRDEALEYKTDICVITALPMEFESLLQLQWSWAEERGDGDAITYRNAVVECDGGAAKIVSAVCPRMGMVSAAVLAANMIRTFRPRVIAMTGICAGLRDRVAIGDIVVVDPSWDYQSGKFLRGEFQAAPHQLPLITPIRRRLMELASREVLAPVKDGWQGRKPDTDLSLHIGPAASGSAVLADKRRLSALKLQHRQLLAVDMEVYGIYAAAAEAPSPAPCAIAIKGVSDFGDESKGDEFREYAAYASSTVFERFVKKEYVGLREFLWK